jgi:ketosteroid isomerase-like protein
VTQFGHYQMPPRYIQRLGKSARAKEMGSSSLCPLFISMNGQDRGKAVPRDNRFTRVWVKQQGHWQLVLNHYSPLIMQQ